MEVNTTTLLIDFIYFYCVNLHTSVERNKLFKIQFIRFVCYKIHLITDTVKVNQVLFAFLVSFYLIVFKQNFRVEYMNVPIALYITSSLFL